MFCNQRDHFISILTPFVYLELEQSEIMAYLNHLPVLDMDQIIAQAFDIRLEVLESRRDFL